MIDDDAPLYPLLGFTAGVIDGAVALRFDFATCRDDYSTGEGERQQFVMTPRPPLRLERPSRNVARWRSGARTDGLHNPGAPCRVRSMRDTTFDGMSDLLTTAQRHAAIATTAWSDLRTAGGDHLSEVADSVHDHAQAAVHLIDRIGCALRQLSANPTTGLIGRRGLTGYNRAFPDLATPRDRARAPLLIDPTNGAAFHEDGSYTFTAQFVTANVRLTPEAMDELAASVREAHGGV